ncbi:hypothetical protein GCM10011386_47780 [Parapedobacter defluvii]|uniref:NVEALA family protein n=1 Tax=Parapedobacter defluvii TaxID=2045106 RepID=A0ABQ1MZP7_9SPHI|nr:NVEALA domain-containing protein [Parapedobacter defluvii]GGC49944.1 hypothetical protein GCM10011386_47780 [Parapedobacter defluvii]
MRKKILVGFAVAVIAAVAALNVNFSMNEGDELSAINLSNVEALAQNESGSGHSYVHCDGHNVQCIGFGDLKCCK